MPQIYRSMKEDNGKPLTGQGSSTLGIRPGTDITVQPDGTVQPDTGGMSVAPSLGALKKFLIPRRLSSVLLEAEGATGKNELHVWKMGTGTFADAPLAPKLALRVDDPEHGLVEPDAVMSLSDYETALQNTRHAWEIDETGTPL